MLPDGCLVHLGRKDFQVKVRGHRIEVAEIEMALLDYKGVKKALVVARNDGDSDTHLIAYLTLAEPTLPLHTALRQFLQKKEIIEHSQGHLGLLFVIG